MSQRGKQKGKRGRRSKSAPRPLAYRIYGPGLEVHLRLDHAPNIARAIRSLSRGIRDGLLLMTQAQAQAAPGEGGEDRVGNPFLRQAVTADLRKMWDAMWTHGPAPVSLEDRDAQFHAWIASPAGQAVIDDVLSDPGEVTAATPEAGSN